MKKTNYQSPTIKIVQLQHRGMLMSSFEEKSIKASRKSYETTDEQTWQ